MLAPPWEGMPPSGIPDDGNNPPPKEGAGGGIWPPPNEKAWKGLVEAPEGIGTDENTGCEDIFPNVIPKDGMPKANGLLKLLENAFDGPTLLPELGKE